jgi:phosphoenolpyruvate-protein kinase (PTS system EI component)
VHAIVDDDTVVLDTTGGAASLWVMPGESVIAEAQKRHAEWTLGRAQEEAKVAAPLAHLGLEVHVNIGSVYERIPTSTEGIGLLRTELVFSGHTRAPSEMEQLAALRAIVALVGSAPVVVRLFDAGGDKPLAWLQAPAASPLARGVELLFMHPGLLDAQLRAIVRVAEHATVRVLLPMARCADDLERIRVLSRGKLAVGAMIETPSAARAAKMTTVSRPFGAVQPAFARTFSERGSPVRAAWAARRGSFASRRRPRSRCVPLKTGASDRTIQVTPAPKETLLTIVVMQARWTAARMGP